jgi:hypothetical protein
MWQTLLFPSVTTASKKIRIGLSQAQNQMASAGEEFRENDPCSNWHTVLEIVFLNLTGYSATFLAMTEVAGLLGDPFLW